MSSPTKLSKADVVSDFRRTQLLDAAREIFAKRGMSGTTVDSIAKRAGVAKGTVYLYYRCKEDILRQVLEEDLAELRDRTVPIIAGAGTIEDRLERFFHAALAFFDHKRDFFEHAHFEMTPDVRRKALQKLELVYRAQLDAWRAALSAAIRNGDAGKMNVDASAVAIVALASGLAKQRLRGWSAEAAADIAKQSASTLWKGLAAR